MAFSNDRLLFCSHGKGNFRVATVVLHPPALHHEQMTPGKEIHTLIAFVVNVMASNTVDGL